MSESVGGSGCHHWRSIEETNDYECDSCGARKNDRGEVTDTMAACNNAEWAAENGETVEWARTMWWCPCEACQPEGGRDNSMAARRWEYWWTMTVGHDYGPIRVPPGSRCGYALDQ